MQSRTGGPVNRSHPKRSTRTRRTAAAIAAATALVVAMLAGPATASAAKIEKGFWGPLTAGGVSQFPVYKDLGVTLYQMGLSWSNVAPTRPANPGDPRDPAYHWPADVDFAIQQARANGMKVLLMITNAPPWANGGKPANWAPRRPADYAAFARAAARRYPTVRHWMIWGEPTRMNNFNPITPQHLTNSRPLTPKQAQAPHRYARILDAAYASLKKVNRRNLVIGGNTYTIGDIRPLRWVQNLKLPNGRPPRMDLYGHNPFSYRGPSLFKPPSGPETVDFSDIGRFSKVVDTYLGKPRGKKIKIFMSEFTVPTDKPDAEFNFYVTRPLQARWIRNGFRIAHRLSDRIYGLGWIHLYDDPPDPAGKIAVVQGGLMTYDGQKKPGYFAFKNG